MREAGEEEDFSSHAFLLSLCPLNLKKTLTQHPHLLTTWWRKEGDVPLGQFGTATQWPPRPRTPWTGVVGGPPCFTYKYKGGKLRKKGQKKKKREKKKEETVKRTKNREKERREKTKEEEKGKQRNREKEERSRIGIERKESREEKEKKKKRERERRKFQPLYSRAFSSLIIGFGFLQSSP